MADGNVFFLEELIRQLAAGRHAELPQSVLSMVTVRLEALDAFQRRVLRCASIFGERFWPAGVVGILGGPSIEQAGAALTELVDREIVVEREEVGPGTERPYAFRHSLLRDAAYAMLTDEDRMLGHRLAAEWLDGRADAEPLSVAEHFEKGRARERAVKWYQRAALAAMHGNDLSGAVERVRRAISCGAADEMLVALQLIAAEANNWDGQFAEARTAALRAYGTAARGSSARDDAIAQLAIAGVNLGDREIIVRVAQDLLQPGLVESFLSRGRTCAWVAQGLLLIGERPLAIELLPRLAECHERAGAGRQVFEGPLERIRSFFAQFEGDLHASRTHLDRALRAFERAGDLRNALDCAVNAGLRAIAAGDHPAAERYSREAVAAGERCAMRHMVAGGKYVLGVAVAMQGRLEEGESIEREALAFFVASGRSRMMCAASHASLATILFLRGALGQAEDEARAAVSDSSGNPQLEATNGGVLARILLAQGRTAEALLVSARAHATLEELGALEEGEILLRLVYAEALAAEGQIEAMRPILRVACERLLSLASRMADPDLRDRFLRNVPENARTLQLATRCLGDDRLEAS
jgi:tetratricopeptide (TPR) repeat protein